MSILPLTFLNGHLFVECEGRLWLVDTGAPTSFGNISSLRIAGEYFSIGSSYFGLTADSLSQYLEIDCIGLLGADVLACFDHIFNIAAQTLTISTPELSHEGQNIRLSNFMGIPIINAIINGSNHQMFLDTGAQISYFQEDHLAEFPSVGSVTDFYPGFGQFQTNIHLVPITLGDSNFLFRCGRLPHTLGAALMMAGTKGIVGNQLLIDRVVGFFPRRGLLCL